MKEWRKKTMKENFKATINFNFDKWSNSALVTEYHNVSEMVNMPLVIETALIDLLLEYESALSSEIVNRFICLTETGCNYANDNGI